ncbi:MAG: hypothetical protein ACKVW3_05490 [Phycisphaerales bacterium]
MRGFNLAVAAAVGGLALPALAQPRVAQLDVNNLKFQARDGTGAPVPFGGVSHTGSLTMTDDVGITEMLSVSMQTGGGPFIPDPLFVGILTLASVRIDLLAGAVVGGQMSFDVNGGPAGGGDRYSANIGPGGSVNTYIGGGFTVEALSTVGMFSDANFAGVLVPDFVAGQGNPPFLQGSFLGFRVIPDGSGGGYSEMDIFVSSVPTPGSLALLGMSGLLAARRRRR